MKKLSLSSPVLAGSVSHSEWLLNTVAISNYVWCGDTQTNDASAIQGGADYAHESGLSVGVWTSNAAGDT